MQHREQWNYLLVSSALHLGGGALRERIVCCDHKQATARWTARLTKPRCIHEIKPTKAGWQAEDVEEYREHLDDNLLLAHGILELQEDFLCKVTAEVQAAVKECNHTTKPR